MTGRERSAREGPYQLFMLGLSVYALAALATDTIVPLRPSTREILGYADVLLCGVFFVDFVIQLARAPNRRQYFFRWGWIDLLSSIPMVDALRIGRAARVLRILRVLRAVRSTRLLASFVLGRRAESAFMAAALVSLILIVFGSVAVLQVENVPGANITTAQDAVWWAFVTITTVGYGDRYPVTWEGRVIAGLLMTAGVGLFGAFSGFVASWFLAGGAREEASERQQESERREETERLQASELRQLRAELASVRELLERRSRGDGA